MNKLFAVILSLGLIISPVPVISDAKAQHETQAEGGGTSSLSNQILGISNGIMGSVILTKCSLGSLQPSLIAYMAGGVTFVAAEILGGQRHKQSLDDQAQSIANVQASGEGGNLQLATIDAQIEMVQGDLDFVKRRRSWMTAMKVVYGIAFTLAIVELWMSLSPPVGLGKSSAGSCSSSNSHGPVVQSVITAYSMLQASGGRFNLMNTAATVGAQLAFPKLISTATSVFDRVTLPIINNAPGRIAFFGAVEFLIFNIDKGLAKEEERLEEIIATLERQREAFVADTNDDGGVGEGPSTTGGSTNPNPINRNNAIRQLPPGQVAPRVCATSSGGGVNFGSNCSNPIRLPRQGLDSRFAIPTLATGLTSAVNFADAVASGNLGAADVEAAKLGELAGRIGKIKEDLLAKANERLKAEGKKPIDINGEVQRQVSELNKALNQSRPGSGNLALPDIGSASVSSSSPVDKDAGTEPQGVAAAPEVSIGSNNSPIDLSGIGEDQEAPVADHTPTLSESLENYEMVESDISKRPDVSIFKQLSNRYFLNYTKIFERKEVLPPPMKPKAQ